MKTKMFDHISETVQHLLCRYPGAEVALGADRNEFDISPLLLIAPKMKQIVTLPTRGNKILSVIITNMSEYYSSPVIHQAVDPDETFPTHKPSDHNVPVAYPLNNSSYMNSSRNYKVKKFRPLPQSGIELCGNWLTQVD